MKLSNLDLNLLVTFDAIYQDRSTTKAGQRIGRTQPAISNALRRLRHLLGDELFVRAAGGLQPTARAHELAGPVRDALVRLSDALEGVHFDPSSARMAFAVSMSDYFAQLLLPTLVERMQKEAPHVDLRIFPNTIQNAPELLDTGTIHIALGGFGNLPARFDRVPIVHDRHVLAMRRGHPLAKGAMTRERLLTAGHLLVTLNGELAHVLDTALAAQGQSRRIVLSVNQFSIIPEILRRTDLVATLHGNLGRQYSASGAIAVRPVPLDLPPVLGFMLWHKRQTNHPGHRWLRGLIAAICQGLDGSGTAGA